MNRTLVKLALGAAAVGGIAVVGLGPVLSAQAQTVATPAPPPSAPPTPAAPGSEGPGGDHHGFGRGGSTEKDLPADIAAKVKAAALAADPGATVDRVSTEDDGVAGALYEAHLTKTDGSHVRLQLDKSFAIVKTETGGPGRGGPGPGGPGHHGPGMGGRGGSGEADLAPDVAAKVTAAALTAVPGGTVDRVSTENDGPAGAVYEALASKADGTRVTVLLDSGFTVLRTTTDEHHR